MKLNELPDSVKTAIEGAVLLVFAAVFVGVFWFLALALEAAGWGPGWLGELWKGITGG